MKDASLIEAPEYKVGLLKKKTLSLVDIENEMNDVYTKMEEYSKNLEPGSEAGLFIGVAIVVLSSQRDQLSVIRSQDKSFFSLLCSGAKDS